MVCKKLKRKGIDIKCHPVNSHVAEKRTHHFVTLINKTKFLSEISRTASQFQWDAKSLEYLVRKTSDQNLLKSYHDEFVKLRNIIRSVQVDAETFLSSSEEVNMAIKPTFLPTVTINPLISSDFKEKQNQRLWLTKSLLKEKQQERLLTTSSPFGAKSKQTVLPYSVQEIESAKLEEDKVWSAQPSIASRGNSLRD